jgi:hypothetical protein
MKVDDNGDEDEEPERCLVGYSLRLPVRLLVTLLFRAISSFATRESKAADAGEDGAVSIEAWRCFGLPWRLVVPPDGRALLGATVASISCVMF